MFASARRLQISAAKLALVPVIPMLTLQYNETASIGGRPGASRVAATTLAGHEVMIGYSTMPIPLLARIATPDEFLPFFPGVAAAHTDNQPSSSARFFAALMSSVLASLCSCSRMTFAVVDLTKSIADAQHVELTDITSSAKGTESTRNWSNSTEPKSP